MHLPSPSYWPLVIAFGLPIVAIGLIFSHVISVVGALFIVIGASTAGCWSRPMADVDDYDAAVRRARSELATVE